jgi:cytoskeletal protein RodZ
MRVSSGRLRSQRVAEINAPWPTASVRISFERPAVATAPAPVIEKPAPVIEKPAPVIEKPAAAVEAPRPAVAVPAPAATAQITVQPQAAAAPAAAPQAAGGVNAVMLSSAYAQLGITQDCTRLVEKALGAAGIPAGDIWPGTLLVTVAYRLSGGRRPDGDGAWAKSPRDGPKRPEAG